MSHECQKIVQNHLAQLQTIVGDSPHAYKHIRAWEFGSYKLERAFRLGVEAYVCLADTFYEMHGTYIGDNGYYTDHARDQLAALGALLNFEVGRLDCGTCDRLILDLAAASHVNLD